jgi:hypothetical protein
MAESQWTPAQPSVVDIGRDFSASIVIWLFLCRSGSLPVGATHIHG